MKRICKIFAVLLVVLIALFSFSITAGATEVHNSQDGLVASITSEKDSYQSNEDIELTFKVTNTNDFAVENVSLEAIIPEGLKLKSKNDTSINTVSLTSGESLELTLTVIKESSVITVPIGDSTEPTPTQTQPLSTENTTVVQTESVQATTTKVNSANTDNTAIKTGNNMSYILVGLICLVCLAVAVLSFKFRKKAVKYLSLVLCVCISVSSVAVVSVTNTMAQETKQQNSFEVSKTITVDNETYEIQNIINYELGNLELCSDIDYVFTTKNEKYYVSFYCKPKTTEFSQLKLYCLDNDTIICDLLDNGDSINGDLASADGIYSARIQINSPIERTYTYKALMETNNKQISSNIVEISVIDDYSDEDYKKIEAVDNSISELLLSDEYKKLELEKKIEKVKELLYTLSIDGTSDYPYSLIKFNSICYEESTHTFGFQYFNGDLSGVNLKSFSNENELFEKFDTTNFRNVNTLFNLRSYSENQNLNIKANVQAKATVFYDFDSDVNKINYYKKILSQWSNSGINTNIITSPTVDVYANGLTDNDIIVLATHGAYIKQKITDWFTDSKKSTICTREVSTEEKDKKYKNDINQHNIAGISGETGKEYWIFPSFFSAHYSNNKIKDSVILMQNCLGFGDDFVDYTLSFELTNVGASTVVGFHGSALQLYSLELVNSIVSNLLDNKTIGESYNESIKQKGSTEKLFVPYARKKYDFSEEQLPDSSDDIYPVLAGNSKFKLPYIENGSLSGEVVSSDNTPLSDVRVDAYLKAESGTQYVGNSYTNDKGNFSMELQGGSYELRFNKDGYKTTVETIKISNDVMTVLIDPIIMEKKEITVNDAFEYNGHYYKIYNNCDTWEDSLSYCENLGGHLATITSAEENDALFNYMKESGYETAYFGFTDRDNESEWKWVTGENVDYTNWSSGEPNNDGNGEENYAEFYYKYTDGTWNDGNFNNGTTNDKCNFICEWDA